MSGEYGQTVNLPVICGSCEAALECEELFGLNREENCVLRLAEIRKKKKKKVHQVTVNVNPVIKITLKSQMSFSLLLRCVTCHFT